MFNNVLLNNLMPQEVSVVNIDVPLDGYATMSGDTKLQTIIKKISSEGMLEEVDTLFTNYHVNTPQELIAALRHGLGTEYINAE